MGGFRLRGAQGTYGVSNRVDQPFAGNCGNKWLALGSENPLEWVGDHKDREAVTDERISRRAIGVSARCAGRPARSRWCKSIAMKE